MSYSKTKWIQVTVPFTPNEHESIKAKAELDERSMANFIRSIVIPKIEKPRPSLGGKS